MPDFVIPRQCCGIQPTRKRIFRLITEKGTVQFIVSSLFFPLCLTLSFYGAPEGSVRGLSRHKRVL